MSASNWQIVPGEERGGERGSEVYAALLREADGIRLDETRWSLGLAEQVGLSVRLAMACHMGGYLTGHLGTRPEPVPIILDDVLSRFDETRQRGAIEALWLASEKLQVIFFTCHRSVVDMFQSRLAGEDGFSVVEMGGNTLLKGHHGKAVKRSVKRR
jgi:hypothetical protein